MRSFALQILVLCLLAISTGLSATEQSVVVANFADWMTAKGTPPGWELKVKSGKASYEVVKDGDAAALHLKSMNSSFSLQGEVDIDIKRFPVLSWKWKVTQLPKGGDFRKSRTDDQAAQLFVAFTETKAIVYIWDTTATQGLMASTSPVSRTDART